MMKLCKPIVYLVCFVFWVSGKTYGQKSNASDHLGIENGLSNSAVRSFFQDHEGFMWIGTNDGLNRYDGYEFKIYRNRVADTTSIIQNWINVVAEDQNNDLWVGTHGGVSIYNRLTESFSSLSYLPQNKKIPEKLNKDVEDIKFDQQGAAYLKVNGEGLVVFEKGSLKSGFVVPCAAAGKNYHVQALAISPTQKLWVTVAGIGLCAYNNQSKQLKPVSGQYRNATRMLFHRNRLWLAGIDGVDCYDVKGNRPGRHFSYPADKFNFKRISSFIVAGNSELWVGIDGSGICVLNEDTGTLKFISNDDKNNAIASNAVLALYKDSNARLWIGMYRGGLNIIDPYKSGFKTIRHETGNPNSLSNNFVLSICEQSPQKVWIGTDGGGVSLLDRTNNSVVNYKHIYGNAASLGGNFITGITKDWQGNVWIASYDGSISRYLPGSNSFDRYYAYASGNKLANATFWLVYEDSKRNLWASALQRGLFILNVKNGRFEQFDPKLNDVLVLKETTDGQLWAGDWNSLIHIDINHKQYKHFEIGNTVRAIHEDLGGILWLGTEGGLVKFDSKHGKIIKRFTDIDGLASNHVMNILSDKAGNLWLSTYNGLSRFNKQLQTFQTYSVADGLPEKEFNYNAAAVLSTGELAFGNINGLTLFYPEMISQRRSDPRLAFTGLTVNNSPAGNSAYVTAAVNGQVSSIKVPYDQAVFNFNFTAIIFPYAEHISYRYRLLNRDRKWYVAGNARSASYARLDPGEYDFQVNCTNKDGKWLNNIISIHISVTPPWYHTWWAYLLYISVIAAAMYIYVTYRVRKTRLIYEVMIARESEKKQRAVQEKEREIHNNRIDFFTSISHEFRTPLSLIINPVKDMLMREHHADDQELKTVYRNARRLLSLVDQLLLFRKTDSGVGDMRVTPLNIVDLCTDVFSCFIQQSKANGINYRLVNAGADLFLFGDREKLEIILFNLISNAIKFTPPGGSVTVCLEEKPKAIHIRVIDSGCGIADQDSNLIFQKFYQSREQGRPAKSGFGIGLYLASQFAQKHCGKLSYQSEKNKGTTFELCLKKGKEHFDPELISEDMITESPMLDEMQVDDIALNRIDRPGEEKFTASNIFSDQKVILVVDDNDEIRSYIKSIFITDYTIHEANDGETGMLMVKDKTPDLIICDVMMPGMSGIEWCSWLKNDPTYSYIPVILLTASPSSENKLKGIDCGADDYLSKPFEKDLLVARVANLLNIRNNLRSYFYNEITLKSNGIAISEEYKAFLQKCIEVVEAHLTDQQFNIKVMAQEVGMSHSNLYRKVKSLSGYTVTAFIRLIRLRKAAEMLINTDYNINQVALETGFNNIKYFRSQFFKLFGVNPSDFIRRNKPVFQKKINIKL